MTSRRLKIGIVCYPTPGGSGVVATELGKSVAELGNDVHFITSGHPSRLREFSERIYLHKVETGDYPLFQQHTPYALSLAVKIREVADQYALDLIHVHYAIPHATSAFLAREMLAPRRLPTITTLHGTDITLVGVMPSFYEITRFSISVSDYITTVSEFLREETVSEFHIEKPIEVIHNFVDTEEFRPACDPHVRARFAPDGTRVLMHVSNFRKVKNIPVIVDIFCGVRERVPSRLVLIGDGPEREAIERLVVERGIRDEVCFLGDQGDVATLLPAADVFMLPSEHESFGLAALEAMSCAVPVIGSNIGGLPEVIVDGETGYLCGPHDVSCMIDLVSKLLQDEPRRLEMGKRARERAAGTFGRSAIVERYLDAYRRVLAEGR